MQNDAVVAVQSNVDACCVYLLSAWQSSYLINWSVDKMQILLRFIVIGYYRQPLCSLAVEPLRIECEMS